MDVKKNDVFHVHTYRCGHAEDVVDEEYIKKAISIGATGIWFTDHAPFPGDPFGNRMKYSDLEEYLGTLSDLKYKYVDRLNVHIGLEIEYFPTFDRNGYYRELTERNDIEFLLLGQHMAEYTTGHYTFEWDAEKLLSGEYVALGKAQIQGINTGYFDAVAHPDRIFRRQREWTKNASILSKEIIDAAYRTNTQLEVNESSKQKIRHYWPEFWEMVERDLCIHGLDAHSLNEIRIL